MMSLLKRNRFIDIILVFCFLQLQPYRVEGQTCYVDDDISSTEIFYPSYTSFNGTFPSVKTCTDECSKLGNTHALIETGSFCYCGDADTLTWNEVGTCSVTCADDGGQCGGTEIGEGTVHEVPVAILPDVNVTLVIATTSIGLGTALTVEILIDGSDEPSELINFGDGSGFIDAKTYTYPLPGTYQVQAAEEESQSLSNILTVQVMDTVSISDQLVCPDILKIGDEEECTINSLRQGGDFVHEYSLKTSASSIDYSARIPAEDVQVIGGTQVNGINDPDATVIDLGSDELHMLLSLVKKDGQITRVRLHMKTAGSIGIYRVTPTCSVGVFCGKINKCVDACPSLNEPITCSGKYCPLTVGCQTGSSCTDGTDPCEGLSSTLLGTLEATAGIFEHEFEEPLKIGQGERIAFGCAGTDCETSGASVETRPKTFMENSAIILSSAADNCASNTVEASHVFLGQVMVRFHDPIPLEMTYKCETATPIPNANVADLSAEAAQNHVLESDLMLSVKLHSPLTSTEFTQDMKIICQEPITMPVFESEVSMKFGEPHAYQVQFSQGAPIFTHATMDGGNVYNYQDIATGGWTYEFMLEFANVGHYTVTFNSSNAISTESYETTVHVIPPVTDNWVLTFDPVCYDIPEGFTMNFNLPAQTQPPWSANITYMAGTESLLANEAINFETEENNGIMEGIEQSRNVVWTPGTHEISVTLVNEVSETTVTETITILPGIRNVDMALLHLEDGDLLPSLGSGNTFIGDSEVYFNLTTSTGSPDKWRCVVTGVVNTTKEIEDLKLENMTFTFPEDGEYSVTCSGYNDVQGWVDSAPQTIHIVSEIQGFQLTKGDIILGKNQMQIILAEFIIYTPLSCVIINYDDGTKQTYGDKALCDKMYPNIEYIRPVSRSPFNVDHIFTEEGSYLVSGSAYDQREIEFVSTVNIPVYDDIKCTMPISSVVEKADLPMNAEKTYKSMEFILSATKQINCSEVYPVSVEWLIQKANLDTGTGFYNFDIKKYPSHNTSKLSMPALALDYGLYKVSHSVTIHIRNDFVLKNSDHTYISIQPTPLSVVIAEGSPSSITRGFGQIFEFNASLSNDPDEKDPIEASNMNYTWFCIRLGEELTYPVDLLTTLYEPTVLQDLPEPGAAYNWDGGGCFGAGVDPIRMSRYEFPFLTSRFVNSDATYEFALQVSKNDRFATRFLQMIITPEIPPTLTASCDPSLSCRDFGGKRYINPTSNVGFIGECNTDCDHYTWDITATEPLDLTETCGPASPPECKSLISGIDEQTLILSKEWLMTYPNVEYYKIRVTGEQTSSSAKGFVEFEVYINKPPDFGYCELTKETGKVLIESFRVNCKNYRDPENIPKLTYGYYYYDQDGAKRSLYDAFNPSYDLILPHGVHTIYADITDNFQAVTTVEVGNVTLSIPTQQELDDYDMAAVTSDLLAKGDEKTVGMIHMAFNSLKGQIESLSLDPKDTANLTADELRERQLEYSYNQREQFHFIETVDMATPGDIQLVSSIMLSSVEGVFTNIGEAISFDLTSKDVAASILSEKVIAALKSVTVANTEMYVPIVRNFLDTMSAMICSSTLMVKINQFAAADEEKGKTYEYDASLDENIDFEVPVDPDLQVAGNVMSLVKAESKIQVEKILSSVHVMFQEVLKRMRLGESLISHSPNNATIIISYLDEFYFKEGYTIDATKNLGSSIKFPKNFCPSKFKEENSNCKSKISIKFIIWPCIPYYYPFNRNFVSPKTRVTTVELYDSDKEIHIYNSTLKIQVNVAQELESNIRNNISTAGSVNARSGMVYNRFFLKTEQNAFLIAIYTETFPPEGLLLFVNHKRMPIGSNYWKAIPVYKMSRNSLGVYKFFVGTTETNGLRGSFYAGIAELREGVTFEEDKNYTRNDFANDISVRFNIQTYAISCYYFDIFLQEWSSEGVEVVDSSETLTTCSSSHLSSFAVGNFLLPNDLDFDYIFAHAGFIDNVTLYATLIVVTSMYIIMLIWGHYMDRKDEEKKGVIPLPDNSKEDKYLYEITFYTGPDAEASTDSKINFILSGDFGETQPRILPPAHNELYRRFSVNSFVMATSIPLGCINYARVLHDNSGEPPLDSWQLQMIVVRDLQTNEKYLFSTNTWLSFNREDAMVDKTFSRTVCADKMDFSESFYLQGNRLLNQDHIWFSIFMRPIVSRYTRKERVSICALFLYLSMLGSALWYDFTPNSPLGEVFKISVFSFSFERLLSGILVLIIIFPVITLLTSVFKRARPRNLRRCRAIEAIEDQRINQYEKTGISEDVAERMAQVDCSENEVPKEKTSFRCLPWWTRWVAWIVMLALIGASGFFVWSYGVMWGEIKTIKWFSSFFLTFLVSILVMQFIKVFLFTCIAAIIGRHNQSEDVDCDEELPTLKSDEAWKHWDPTDDSFKSKVHEIEGVDNDDPFVSSLRTRLMKEREMYYVVRGIFAYLFFLAVLLVLSYNITDYNGLLMKESLQSAFVKKGSLKGDLHKVTNANEWWSWCKNYLMLELRAQNHYNNKPALGLKGFIGDHTNRIMGYAIIRQIRSSPDSCSVPDRLSKMIKSCSGSRGITNEDEHSYCVRWAYNATDPNDCAWPEFQYATAKELQTYWSSGQLSNYGGGGYVFRLDEKQDIVLKKMESLQKNNWIDQYTRALLIEFSVYNPNVNLFAICTIHAEFAEGGGILPSYRFEPIRLIPNTDWTGYLNSICEYLFCIITVFFTISNLWEMKKEKCAYFSSYWNLAELIILIVSYVTIAFYILKYIRTNEATTEFNRTRGNAYIRMDTAAQYNQYASYFFGVIIFFAILKLIKLLQFNKRMDVLALTIGTCWQELKIFLIAFAIVFFGFSCLFFFMFKEALKQFSTILAAIQTSFTMMMGKFDYEAMNTVNPMSPLLFFIFSLLNVMILINMMLSIIIRSFQQVKENLRLRENRLDVFDFMVKSVKQKVRKENLPRIHVKPKFSEKPSISEEDDQSQKTSKSQELPDKVGQLLHHINQLYFEGKLNLNDPNHRKAILGSSQATSTNSGNAERSFNSD